MYIQKVINLNEKKWRKVRKTTMSNRPPGCKIQLEDINEIKKQESNASMKVNTAAGTDAQNRFIPQCIIEAGLYIAGYILLIMSITGKLL